MLRFKTTELSEPAGGAEQKGAAGFFINVDDKGRGGRGRRILFFRRETLIEQLVLKQVCCWAREASESIWVG